MVEPLITGLSERYLDTINLFNYGFNNFSSKNIQNKNDIVKTLEISKAAKWDNKLDLYAEDDIVVLLNNSNISNIYLPEIRINDNIEAPIKKGDILGTVVYNIDNIEYSTNLIATRDVERFNFFKSFGSTFLKIVIALVIIFIIITIYKNYKARKELNMYKARRKRF